MFRRLGLCSILNASFELKLLAVFSSTKNVYSMGRKSTAKPRLETAALALFSVRGYNTVSVDELCKSAGVHKGTFYHFFASKDELFLRFCELSQEPLSVLSQDVVHMYSGREAILKFCEGVLPHLLVRIQHSGEEFTEFSGCVPVNVGLELGVSSELSAPAVSFLSSIQAMFQQQCELAQANGNIPFHKDAQEVAEQLYNSWFGACAMARFNRSTTSYEAFLLSLETTLDALEN